MKPSGLPSCRGIAIFAVIWLASSAPHAAVIFDTNTTWSYFKGRSEASTPDPTSWRNVNFDDSAFTVAPAPFWYGDPMEGGTHLNDMSGQYTCIFMRRLFVITNRAEFSTLQLGYRCDDGFVAWINGMEVYRYNVPPGDVNYLGTASAVVAEPVPFSLVDISRGAMLTLGTNVIAIQAFNASLNNSDLGIDIALSTTGPSFAAPSIISQPISQEVKEGRSASLAVVADGALPLHYQWSKNGTPIAGATGAILSLGRTRADQAGDYVITVTNILGSVTSSVAVIVVRPPWSGSVFAWGENSFGQTNVPADLQPVTALSAGQSHTLALQRDGKVVAWGSSNLAIVPDGLSGVVAIAAGYSHSVALREDGTVVAWGDNSSGQTNVPTGLDQVIDVAAGRAHTVALRRDGTVTAWGYDGNGQSTPPLGLSAVAAIAAGDGHSVALKRDGTVVAWGYNANGQTDVPLGLDGVIAIATGQHHTLALKRDGTVAAWGFHGTAVPFGLSGVVAVCAAKFHSMALTGDGSIFGWEDSFLGEITTPSAVGKIVDIATGFDHSVGLLVPSGIVTQPISQTVSLGQDVTFSVVAKGAETLLYQWYKDRVPLVWATNATLILTNVQSSQAGTYTVVVPNSSLGNVTSAVAELTILTDVVITLQPESQQLALGQTATLTVAAAGAPPIVYQWYFNGQPMFGPGGQSLVLTNFTAAQEGIYSAMAINGHSSALSSNAMVTAGYPPTILRQPEDQNAIPGMVVPFSVGVTGTAPFAFQWFKDNAAIPAAIDENYSFIALPSSGGGFWVVISNRWGTAASSVVRLTVHVPPTILHHPESQRLAAGSLATLGVSAIGELPFTYQWQFDGSDLVDATNSVLLLPNLSPSDSGAYRVVVSNQAGMVLSDEAFLTVVIPPRLVLERLLLDYPLLTLHCAKGHDYEIQYSADLLPPSWMSLVSFSNVDSDMKIFIDTTSATNSLRAYRVLDKRGP